MKDGPPLEVLTRRLAECPPDFLAPPRLGRNGTVVVPAVVNDLLVGFGAEPLGRARAAAFDTRSARSRNRLQVVLVAAWLLADPWYRDNVSGSEAVYEFLSTGLAELGLAVKAHDLVHDPDRREELARLSLQALDFRPAGESDAQAQDRLQALNTVERQRVIRAAQQAEQRAREIREAMARKAAEEAADKWPRE